MCRIYIYIYIYIYNVYAYVYVEYCVLLLDFWNYFNWVKVSIRTNKINCLLLKWMTPCNSLKYNQKAMRMKRTIKLSDCFNQVFLSGFLTSIFWIREIIKKSNLFRSNITVYSFHSNHLKKISSLLLFHLIFY